MPDAALIDLPSLEPLFAPRSIAVIGASGTVGKIGAAPLAFLRDHGFDGPIFPVNPRVAEIGGLKAYASVRDIEAPVDMAIFAVPAERLEGSVADCAAKGVRAGVIFTSGLAEAGPEGEAAQRRIAGIARAAGMRLLGPNCLGIANYASGVVASFSPFFWKAPAGVGRMALVSQSGAFGGYAAMAAQDLGLSFSYWVTTGNEADVDLADGLAFLASDPQTRVILAYMEGCRNGPKLIEALRMCHRRRTPVVMLKVGRTEIGAAAAASHTASLAGQDSVYDAVFAQNGVYRADSIDEWFDIGRAAALGRFPSSDRVALFTASGGVGVFMADEAVARGLDVAPLPDDAQAAVRALVPFAGTRNPIDVTGQTLADVGLFEQAIDAVLARSDYGSIVSFHAGIGRSPAAGGRLQKAWGEVRRRFPDAIVAVSGAGTPEIERAYEDEGCLVFRDPGRAVRAVAALSRLGSFFERDITPPETPSPSARLPHRAMSEVEACDALEGAGLPIAPRQLVASSSEARAAADALGYPVVLKIVSPDILHKTDVGGVALSLQDGDAVAEAFTLTTDRARAAVPNARIEGCLVAPMIRGGVETILGVQRDPVFGPVVMFGLGGVLVEVMRDVSFRVAPFDEAEALRMIGETRASAVLRGVRGAPAADVATLARALSRLSLFAAAHADTILSIDVNPFLVLPQGEGAVALDAVILVDAEA